MNNYQNSIDLRSICLRRSGREILKQVDWLSPAGAHWAVIGANGSGKTTLLQIVGGVLFPTSGTAEVLGCRFGASDLFQLRRRIGWISSALNARIARHEPVLDIVLSGMRATFGLVYEYSDHDSKLACDNLKMVGLADRIDAEFGVLSQGEQQKVLFARSLMADPELLIFDEACSGLDLKARESFLTVVGQVMEERRASVIMVSHHIEEIPPTVANALVLKDGKVLANGLTSQIFTSEILSDAFSIDVRVEQRDDRFWARAKA